MLPVWHSNNEAVDAELAGSVNHLFQRRDKNLATFQSKAPLRRPFLGEELLKVGRAQ